MYIQFTGSLDGGRMLGNFPLAMAHMALVNIARTLILSDHETTGLVRQGERPSSAGPHRGGNRRDVMTVAMRLRKEA